MAVHQVALAAMHLARGGGTTTHLVSTLVWPYLLRLCLCLRVARQDLFTSSRLFLFQLAQILTVDQHQHSDDQNNLTAVNNDNNNNNNSRWYRALRLVRQRVDSTRGWNSNNNPAVAQHNEDSLRLLSSLAL